MIPYLEAHPFKLGGFLIQPFALLVAAGIMTGHLAAIWRARRLGLDGFAAARLTFWMAVGGVAGAILFKALYHPALGSILRAIPDNPSAAFRLVGGISSFGGIFGGLLAAWICLRPTPRETAWRYLDVVAFVFPFAWIFGRAGCSLVHDHPGIRSASWAAVRYPGGSRFDLAVIEVFFIVALIALFLVLDRRVRPPGFYLGTLFLLYGIFRFALDHLHVDPPRYLGWSVDQYASGALALAGVLSLRIATRPAPAALSGPTPPL
jgi:phosphatidylglycerol:prolipoprotein diacylglycerol transferase